MFKSGFVSVIGRSNVGKSSFLNRIMKTKLSIISHKPQTTRDRIQLIHTDEDAQIIFLDTPGVQNPKNKLGGIMHKASLGTIRESDLVLYIVDTSVTIGDIDAQIMEQLKTVRQDIILLINKSDRASDDILNEVQKLYQEVGLFKKIICISALENINIDKAVDAIKELLPEGPMYYAEDEITDQPTKKIVSEIIREKALLNLEDEIPHGVAVTVDRFKQRHNKNIIDIEATVIVEKKSHKGMVIGENGQMLKKIGSQARVDIEEFLQSKVFLKLWVKVSTDWRNKTGILKSLGYKE